MRIVKLLLSALALTCVGQAGAQPLLVADSGDSAWMLGAALFVLLGGLGGFALIHARATSAAGTLVTLVTAAAVALVFAVFGYSLIFSEGGGLIGGSANLFLTDLAELRGEDTISETVFAFFQLAVAIFGTSLLVSGLAPRARFGWLAAFAVLWFVIVYLPIAHWLWGDGWLAAAGAIDLSGGMVVHVAAGTAALVAGVLVGRRGETALTTMPSTPLAGLALVVTAGLALAGGALLAATDSAASAMIDVLLAVSTALLAGLGFERLRRGTISIEGAAVSALAGLAAMASGAGAVGVGGAIVVGLLGALAATLASLAVARLELGSAGSVFAAHFGGGAVGALAFPVFVLDALGGPGFDDGIGLGGQLAAQALAVGSVALWSAGLTAVAALMVAMIIPMRGKADD